MHEFRFGERTKPGISVGTSEAFSLPRAFPNLRDVEVYLGWFAGASRPMQALPLVGAGPAKVPGVTTLMGAAAERFVKTSTGGPDEVAWSATGSRFVAEALSASGEVLATVRAEGVNGYTFTGEALAWAAERIAAGDSDGAGALGLVEAFGLEALEAGVAECDRAGLARDDRPAVVRPQPGICPRVRRSSAAHAGCPIDHWYLSPFGSAVSRRP